MRPPPKPYDQNSEEDMLRAMQDAARLFPVASGEFREWAERVEEDANMICRGLRGEDVKGAIGDFGIHMSRVSAKNVRCIIDAITRNYDHMPVSLQLWYMPLKNYLRMQERRFHASDETNTKGT